MRFTEGWSRGIIESYSKFEQRSKAEWRLSYQGTYVFNNQAQLHILKQIELGKV